MKKLFFGLLSTILFTTLSFAQDIEGFVNDPMFKEYINDSKELFNQKYDVKTLNRFLEDKQIDEVEFKLLYIAFGFNTHQDFVEHLQVQSNRLQELSSKYQVNSQTAGSGDFRDGIKSLYDPGENGAGEDFCRQKYANCMIIANATAVAAHLACGALDITVILGAACHASAMAAHYAMMDNCRIEYLQCGKL